MDVLIVDDNINNLRLLSAILEEKGYQVRKVTNSKFALKTISLAPPDLILLDINMPELDGFGVCRYLKADRRTRDIPVIFLSAFSQAQQKREAFRAGGIDYITKPFQVEEVLARVKHQQILHQCQLDGKRAWREADLLRAIAIARAQQPDRSSFLQVALTQVCQTLEWDVGEVWSVRGTSLVCDGSTYIGHDRLTEFVRERCTHKFELQADVPASVWKDRQVEWIVDLEDARNLPFLRNSTATDAGLKSALVAPMGFEQELRGMLGLYARVRRNSDRHEVQQLEAVAASLSSF